MISKEKLISIAKLYDRKTWQQEKHYIQFFIFVTLSEYPLVFKGGTYLWFFHGLDRFSEDVDLMAIGDLPNDLDTKVSEGLRLFGVENILKRINNSDCNFSFRVSAKGPLNTSDIDLCHIYVEISKRENLVADSLSVKLNFDAYEAPTKIINGMSINEVAAEKIRAIMKRKKPRDVYDLFFLIKNKGIKFNIELINKKLKYYDEIFSEQEFVDSLKKKRDDWNKELKQIVFGKLVDFDTAENAILEWIKTR
ncbi:MAG: nucleotidyl transferase AbiEii/AbiGii toxin family protein [Candidatus Micrarchaeota archaeon]